MSLRPGCVSASLSVNPQMQRGRRSHLRSVLSERLLSRSLYFGSTLHFSFSVVYFKRCGFPPFGLGVLDFALLFKDRMPLPAGVGGELT